MNKPLNEKALWAANKVFNSYLAGQREANGTTRAIIDKYLEATQTGDSEAVAYLSENGAQLLANGSNYVLCYSKAAANSFERRGYSIKPLYAAPPSLAALQADNERLRDAFREGWSIGQGDISEYEPAAWKRSKTRATLAGQEKPE